MLTTPKGGRIGTDLANSSIYSEGNKGQLTVFPNPNAGQEFYVKTLEDVDDSTISLYSMTGQSMSLNQRKIDAQTVSIQPVQKLISGVYLIVSQVEGKVNAVKVVIE